MSGPETTLGCRLRICKPCGQVPPESSLNASYIRVGIVGAGGLGQLLFYYLSLFQTDRTCTVILAMIAIVLLVDRLSYEARRWMTR